MPHSSRRFPVKAAVLLPCLLMLPCVTAPSARAGGLLGALYDTCLGSLGEPVNYAHLPTPAPGAEVYAFRQQGWVITVYFWRHQAHLVIYEKQVANALIPPAESEAILRSYGDTQPWTQRAGGERVRVDGKVRAHVGPARTAVFSTAFSQANALYLDR